MFFYGHTDECTSICSNFTSAFRAGEAAETAQSCIVLSLLLIVYALLCRQEVSCCGLETSSELRNLNLPKDL